MLKTEIFDVLLNVKQIFISEALRHIAFSFCREVEQETYCFVRSLCVDSTPYRTDICKRELFT